MSSKPYEICGWGFEPVISDEGLRKFIEKHRETIIKLSYGKEILEYTETHKDASFNPKEDLFYLLADHSSSEPGIYVLITDVMFLETGIMFEYYHGNNEEYGVGSNEAIVLRELMPWQMTEAEKELNCVNDLESICKPYIKEMDGLGVVFAYFEIQYYG